MKRCLATLVVCASAMSAHATAPSLEAIRKTLWNEPQIEISGEQAQLDAGTPGQARQYEKFTLKFERATGRMRLTYLRVQRKDERLEIEAWGTKNCLNLMQVEGILGNVTLVKCVKATELFSYLSRGTSAPAAPVWALYWLLENRFPASGDPLDKFAVTFDSAGLVVTATSPQAYVLSRSWLADNGNSIVHVQTGEEGHHARANFKTRSVSFSAKDFEYAPSEENKILAEVVGQDLNLLRPKLEALAAGGSRRAKLQLLTPAVGVLIGYGRGPIDVEKTWDDLDRLGAMGIAFATGGQGNWLAHGKPEQLPKRFRHLTPQQRLDQGLVLMWKAARLCDGETLEILDKHYMGRRMGDGDDRPTDGGKMREVARVRKECTDKAAGPELRKAARDFADPWPRR